MDEVNAALAQEGHADVYELPPRPAPVVIVALGVGAALIGPELGIGVVITRLAWAFA